MIARDEPIGGFDATPKITLRAYERGLFALHVSILLYLFSRLVGPIVWSDVKGELMGGLDPLDPLPYGRGLRDRLDQLLKQSPEFVIVLEQPDGLETALDMVCQVVEEMVFAQVPVEELEKLQRLMKSALDRIESKLAIVQGDGKPPLGDELETDLETIAREPRRLLKGIPSKTLGLGARERRNLEALGLSNGASDDQQAGEYAQTIIPTLVKLVLSPEVVDHIPLTANSRVWALAGTLPPKTDNLFPAEQSVKLAMDAIANLLKHMATLKGRRDLVGFVLGQQLRHEYGLGEGRGHESVPLQNLEDMRAGVEGYAEIDARLDLEALINSAPPKQREAIELYLESYRMERPVEELARERGLNPVNVRNNLNALAKKHRH